MTKDEVINTTQTKCKSTSTPICKKDYLNGSKAEYDCETASWNITLKRHTANTTVYLQVKLIGGGCEYTRNLEFPESQV